MQRYRPWPQMLTRLTCLLLLAALAQEASLAQGRPLASVIKVTGDLVVRRKGTTVFRPLVQRGTLYEGDIVGTGPGGRAEIIFNSGTLVKLDRRSAIEILPDPGYQNKRSLFRAISGFIWSRLRPGQRIKAPPANIVVPGTEILLAVAEDGTTTVTVVEGVIVFFNEEGTVEVRGAQQSTARVGQAPTPPVAVDVSGLIAWTADIAGLPLEFETPFISPDPAVLRPLRAEREATVRAALGRAPLYQGLGEALHDLGEYQAAANAFETAARLDPASAAAYAGLGQAKRGQGDTRGAIAAFESALQREPGNTTARVGLGLTYLAQGDPQRARAALEAAGRLAPALTALALLDLQDDRAPDAAAAKLQEAIALDPRMYQAHALLALADLTRNRTAPAEQSAREAARLQPNSAQAQGTLGMVLFFNGRPAEATGAAERAARLNPLSPFALLTRGRVLLSRQRTDEARTAFERAVALAPDLWLAHTDLGAVYLRLDLLPRAAAAYRRALELNPDSPDAHTGLGIALQRQGQVAEAETAHRKALELSPDNTTARGNLAALYIEQGRLDQARGELEQGVRAQPERGILYARLAEISLYRQDLFSAQEFARRAVQLLPDSAVAHYQLGRVYLEQERVVQAQERFRQAAALDPQFAEARFALGFSRELMESGRVLSRPLGSVASASASGPGQQLSIQNLQTPGAEERIQAAIQDPTVLRVASRSFGDFQLDAQAGAQGTLDFATSFLRGSGDGRGVTGLAAQRLHTEGVRQNADMTDERFGLTLGRKAQAGPTGFLVQGQFQRLNQGADSGEASDPYLATVRDDRKFPYVLFGVNGQTGERHRTRALVQIDRPEQEITDAFGFTQVDVRSVHAEARHDVSLGSRHLLTVGAGAGRRRSEAESLLLSFEPGGPDDRRFNARTVEAAQVYLRDTFAAGPRLTLTGELRIDWLDARFQEGPDAASASESGHRTAVGLPAFIAAYRPDVRSGLRFRARRLLGTVEDFELLAPTDVALFSAADVPRLLLFGRGRSYELEYDYTFRDASLLRLALFRQDLKAAAVTPDARFVSARFLGARVGYEGALNRATTFFVSVDINDAAGVTDLGEEGVSPEQALSDVPRFLGTAGVQYLDRRGWFVQPSCAYVGSRVTDTRTRDRAGGFGVLNLRAGKRSGLRSAVFVEVINALNKRHMAAGILQPGALVRLGVSQRF